MAPNERAERARKILKILSRQFPDARCRLDHNNALDLLVATILAAQCTDERVNEVTAELFKKYKRAADYARADRAAFENEIRPTGFYRNKTRSILAMANALLERHGGEVPRTIDELAKLPGVGRKTANVLIGAVFGGAAIIVDTHFKRVMNRAALSARKDPDKIEADIRELLDSKDWTPFSNAVNFHGRLVCQSRKPKCDICKITSLCGYYNGTQSV